MILKLWVANLICGEFVGFEEMCSVDFSLVFEFVICRGILLGRVSFLFAGTKPKNNKQQHGVWWTERRGFGISSIASSSRGDRKKGYPKLQTLWELTLALGRFPFDFAICFAFCVFPRF